MSTDSIKRKCDNNDRNKYLIIYCCKHLIIYFNNKYLEREYSKNIVPVWL